MYDTILALELLRIEIIIIDRDILLVGRCIFIIGVSHRPLQKFYLRCLKYGNTMPYTCPKDRRCLITKETRSHCQFCRLQKCLHLEMYKPGIQIKSHLN